MCKATFPASKNRVEIKLWTNIHDVESQALTQLINISALPWVFKHVAVMPDVHFGKGATVGSVIAMKNAVSPAAVGVDIGCGMGAIKTNLKAGDLPDNLGEIYDDICGSIPVGFNSHEYDSYIDRVNPQLGRDVAQLFSEFKVLHHKVHDLEANAMRQIGTLGGGNHFIELCLDTEDNVWMMLHSGSRNIGKSLAEIHMDKAMKLTHNAELPDKDLSVFLSGTTEMADYRRDLFWAQRYAFANRQAMFELYKRIMQKHFRDVQFEEPILCHHNYVSEETHFGEDLIVTRKGAISAASGELGIIPGAMGKKSFIVRGRGNPDSFNSASHGAGRRMSRGEAKRRFTTDDLERSTQGVMCRKDHGVVDEIGEAYKPIKEVMANQEDLVEIVAELRGIIVVKG